MGAAGRSASLGFVLICAEFGKRLVVNLEVVGGFALK